MIHAAPAPANRARALHALTPIAANLAIGTLLRLALPYTLADSGERYRYYAMSLFFPIRDCPSFHCFRVLPPLLASLLPLEVIDGFIVTGFVFQVLAGVMVWLIAEHLHGSRRVAAYATAFYWATWAPIQSFGDPLLITDPVAAFWSLTSLYLLLERRYVLAIVVLATGATVKEGILLIPAVYAVYVFLAKDEARRNLAWLATLFGAPVVSWLLLRVVLSNYFGYVVYQDESYIRETYFFGLWLPNLSTWPRNLLIAALYVFGACGAAWILGPLGLRHANRRQVALTIATLPPMVFLALYQVPDRALATFPYATLIPAALVLSRLPAPISIALLVVNAAFTVRMNTSVAWLPRIPILLAALAVLTIVAVWLDLRGRAAPSERPRTLPDATNAYARWAASASVAVSVALFFAVSLHAWRVNARVRTIEWDPNRLPAAADDEANTPAFAISPDGGSIVFVGVDRGPDGIATRRLWRRGIDEPSGVPIAGTALAGAPFWSPDGSSLGFFADGRLKTLNLASGAVMSLADAPFSRGGAWSSRGVIVFAPDLTGGLYQVAASGGRVSPATTLDASRRERSHRWPSFLPDGTHLIFQARAARRSDSALYVTDLASGARQLISADQGNASYAGPGFLMIGRDDGLWMQPFDVTRLRLFSYRTKLATADFSTATNRAAFAISDNALVYAGRAGTLGNDRPSRLRWVDARGGLIAGAMPDAATAREWSVNVPGMPAAAPGDPVVTSRSPDGRVVLFQTRPPATAASPLRPGPWNVWMQRAGAPRSEAVPLGAEGSNRVQAQFSPDGRWIAYVSDETGADEVYVQPFPQTGEQWQVSIDGGAQPRWRGAREIVYVVRDRFVRSVTADAAGEFRTATPRHLFEVALRAEDRSARQFEYAVSPDGSRFLMNVVDAPGWTAPVTVLSGWKAGQITR
jgi:hypothetical protein